MLDHFLDILGVHRVEDIVEVRPIRVAIFGVLVLQKLHDCRVAMELGEDVHDTKLIILWHCDELTRCHRKQRLVSLEHESEEVTIDSGDWWHVHLHYRNMVRM